jgi:hypothetical protein
MLLFDPQAIPSQVNGDRGCTLFQISNPNAVTNELEKSAIAFPPFEFRIWNPAVNQPGLVPFDYTAGTSGTVRNIGTLRWIRFYISAAPVVVSGVLPTSNLMMHELGVDTPQILAEGIEDMQLAYGCDNNPNEGVINEGVAGARNDGADEWVLNDPADNARTYMPYRRCNVPEAVRLTLVARSVSPDTLAVGSSLSATIEDRSTSSYAAPPADVKGQYRRRRSTVTVFMRN